LNVRSGNYQSFVQDHRQHVDAPEQTFVAREPQRGTKREDAKRHKAFCGRRLCGYYARLAFHTDNSTEDL
jgi:hypothetical protein